MDLRIVLEIIYEKIWSKERMVRDINSQVSVHMRKQLNRRRIPLGMSPVFGMLKISNKGSRKLVLSPIRRCSIFV